MSFNTANGNIGTAGRETGCVQKSDLAQPCNKFPRV